MTFARFPYLPRTIALGAFALLLLGTPHAAHAADPLTITDIQFTADPNGVDYLCSATLTNISGVALSLDSLSVGFVAPGSDFLQVDYLPFNGVPFTLSGDIGSNQFAGALFGIHAIPGTPGDLYFGSLTLSGQDATDSPDPLPYSVTENFQIPVTGVSLVVPEAGTALLLPLAGCLLLALRRRKEIGA